MEKNALPSLNNKTVVLSLATCALLGIIGFEAFLEKSAGKTSVSTQNFYPYPLELQNEQLKIELNHSRLELNELKRQLFVRTKAPDSLQIRKLQKEIVDNSHLVESLKQAVHTHEQELFSERAKIMTLETSLSALAELIEIQKITKERFEDTLEQSIAYSREEALNQIQYMTDQLEGTIAKQSEEIDQLKNKILIEQEEKELLLVSIHESNAHRIELIDQLTIERTYEKLAYSNLQHALTALKETKETLLEELDNLRSKLEHEKRQKEELNQTIAALLSKAEEVDSELALNSKMAERGSELEDQIAFEKALQGIEKERLNQSYLQDLILLEENFKSLTGALSDLQREYDELQTLAEANSSFEKSNVEDALVFEQLINKITLERLKVELDDLAYALLSSQHQNTLLKESLDDYLATHEHLKGQLEDQNEKHFDKVGSLETELTFLKSLLEDEKQKQLLGHSEQEDRLASLEEECKTIKSELATAYIVKEELEQRLTELSSALQLEQKSKEEIIASLAEKETYSHQLEHSLREAENSLEKAALALETLETASLEEELAVLSIEKETIQNKLAALLDEKTVQEDYILKLEEKTTSQQALADELNVHFIQLESTHSSTLSSLKEEKQQLENTINGLNTHLAQLETSYKENLDAITNKGTDRAQDLEEKLATQEEALSRLNAHIAQLESTHSTTLSSLEEEKQQLENTISHLNTHLAQLETSYKENLDAITNKGTAREQDLEGKLATQEEALSRLNAHIAQLETSYKENLNVLANERKSLEQDLAAHSVTQEEELIRLNAHIVQLESSYAENLASLEKEKEKILEELVELLRVKSTQEEYALHLEQSLHTAENALEKAALAFDALEDKATSLSSLEEENHRLEHELSQLNAYMTKLKSSHTEELNDLLSAKSEVEERMRYVSAVEEEKQKLEATLNELNTYLAHLESTHNETQQTHASNLTHLADENQKLKSNLDELHIYVASLHSAHKEALESKDLEKMGAIGEIKDHNELLESDLQQTLQALTHAKEESENLNAHIAHLEEALKQNDQAHEEMRALLQSKAKQEEYVHHLEQSLEVAEHSLNTASETLETLHKSAGDQFAALKEQYDALIHAKQLQVEHILTLEQELAQTERNLQNTTYDFVLKTTELGEMEQVNHLLKERLVQADDLEKDLQKIHVKYQEALNSVEYLQVELESKEEEHSHLKTHNEILSTEANTIRALLENEQKQTAEFAFQLAEIQEHYLDAQSKIHELTAKNEHHTLHVQDLSDQLFKSYGEKDQAMSQLQSLAESVEKQKEALRTLQHQRDSLAEVIKNFQLVSEEISSIP